MKRKSGKKREDRGSMDILKEIVLSYPLFHTEEGVTLILVSEGLSDNLLDVESSKFKEHLVYKMHKEHNLIINIEMLKPLITLLHASAKREGEKIKSFKRVGKDKGFFLYNLANEYGDVVKIGSKEYRLVQNNRVAFIESESSLEQIEPICNSKIDIYSLKKYINLREEREFILLLTHIISCFVPEISHHILMLVGNQGSSKSTVSRIIKKIVDPSILDVSTIPSGKDDLILQLSKEYMIVFDNIDTLKTEFSNIFCQVVTGGSSSKRKLYTNDEMVVYSYRRCLILNGINCVTAQADLLDRSIIMNLEKIPSSKRKTEIELIKEFNKDLPYIMHSIFETLVMAKEIHKTLRVSNLPRMADAVEWQCCIAEALGIKHEDFLEIYNNNRNEVNTEVLFSDATAQVIIRFMERKKVWKGTYGTLWKELKDIAEEKDVIHDNTWSHSASALSRKLSSLKTNLEDVGICFDRKATSNNKEIILKNLKVKEKNNGK